MSAHAELAWLLGCLTPLGWLNRMTQFKEKAGKQREEAGLGLYAYPVLMAADILLYKATHVPVGEDQKQHLELARDIAGAFNRRYDVDFFPLPEPQIFGAGDAGDEPRDGTKKMSKSDASDYSRINMTDDADTIALKIRQAPRPIRCRSCPRARRSPASGPKPTICSASTRRCRDMTRAESDREILRQAILRLQGRAGGLAVEVLGKIGGEMRRLLADPGYIDGVLKRGAERANAIAAPVMRDVFDIMGLLRP